MDNCCIFPPQSNSWIDWLHAMPMDPFQVIQNAASGATQGVLVNSTNYNNSTWAANTVVLKSGQTPTVSALETTNAQMVADASQWNFRSQTNNAAATLMIRLKDPVFVARNQTQQIRGSDYRFLRTQIWFHLDIICCS